MTMMEYSAKRDLFLQFKALYDAAGHFMDYLFIDASSNFEALFGAPKTALIGRRMSDLVVEYEDHFLRLNDIYNAMIPNTVKKFEKYIPEKEAWYLVTIMADDPSQLFLYLSDITEIRSQMEITSLDEEQQDLKKAPTFPEYMRKKDKADQHHAQFIDRLTGIYNRHYFEEEMIRLDVKRQLPLSIIVGDINGLKIINDAFGHRTGDHVLRETAKIIKHSLREEDILARVGGDEFAALLPRTSLEKAEGIVERIKAACDERPLEYLNLSISFGVAEKREEGDSLIDVYQRADDRMYHRKLIESKEMKEGIVRHILHWLEDLEVETQGHFARLKRLSERVGKAVGLTPEQIRDLKLLAEYHDIGKVFVPKELLLKRDAPTQEEWEVLKRHAEIGYRLASSIYEIHYIDELVLDHHERWDGKGYPSGLKGEEIPIVDRVFALLDAYDTMLHDQPYRERKSLDEAIREIETGAGKQFDPEITGTFLELLRTEGPLH
jgi:diguanylate cyclase (GGDEF)-like protein